MDTTTCTKCNGTGVYTWDVHSGQQRSGKCFQCRGTGVETAADAARTQRYWAHRERQATGQLVQARCEVLKIRERCWTVRLTLGDQVLDYRRFAKTKKEAARIARVCELRAAAGETPSGDVWDAR